MTNNPETTSLSKPILRGSVGRDYRNLPNPARLEGFEVALISARSPVSTRREIAANGQRLFYWLQPFLTYWNGAPVLDFEWDRIRHELVGNRRLDDVLSPDLGDCKIIDFSVPGLGIALANAEASYLKQSWWPNGLLFDYGTDDLAWLSGWGNSKDPFWLKWGLGYIQYRAVLRSVFPGAAMVMQTFRTRSRKTGYYLEKIGSLIPEWMAAPLAISGGMDSILEVRPTQLHLFYVALVHGLYYEYQPTIAPGSEAPQRDLFLSLGLPTNRVYADGGLLIREFENGRVGYNLTTKEVYHSVQS